MPLHQLAAVNQAKGLHQYLRYSVHFLPTKANLNWQSKYFNNKAAIANISLMINHAMDYR